MKTSRTFDPDWASAPGETVQDYLEQNSVSVEAFAKTMGWAENKAHWLIKGWLPIDHRVAERLSQVVGSTPEFWLRREKIFRDAVSGRRTNEMQLRVLRVERMIKESIDGWSKKTLEVGPRPEHQDLAHHITNCIEPYIRLPPGSQGLLLDVDKETGLYTNPRIVEWDGVEETLYPVNPETDEPVEEAVADIAMPLPHVDSLPEL